MFITFDYKCPNCQKFDTKFVRRDDMDSQKCEDCNVELVRLPAGTRTTFRFADTKLKD